MKEFLQINRCFICNKSLKKDKVNSNNSYYSPADHYVCPAGHFYVKIGYGIIYFLGNFKQEIKLLYIKISYNTKSFNVSQYSHCENFDEIHIDAISHTKDNTLIFNIDHFDYLGEEYIKNFLLLA